MTSHERVGSVLSLFDGAVLRLTFELLVRRVELTHVLLLCQLQFVKQLLKAVV